ncbi:acyltransferase [Rhizobium sp. P38BS-XIX]|uniref:acyltransferase family protein n=1 Tax=Rhizobium sp. P38BS-XIX TaxID=2726740 RepID=UPI0014573415|nr:acyltransferase [Rhizobium sp. P38BS-XIX]NLR98434.1 acyltransferase [Rhizobium sp. P38BS-XIX]
MSNVEKNSHIPALDGWRGFAVMLVLIGHFGGDGYFPNLGSSGVDLFFVLSGRLMAEILFLRKMPLRRFFFRRFTRVYPALFVFVFVSGILLAPTSISPGAIGIFGALTFTLNYLIIESGTFVPTFDHIWSLCVEEQSYVLLVIMAVLLRGASIRVIGLSVLALGIAALANGIVQYDIYGRNPFVVFWPTDVATAPILISAAIFLLFGELLNQPRLTWIVPLGFFGGVILRVFGDSAWAFFGAKALLMSVAVCALGQSTRFSKALFEGPLIRQIGRMSFSLYIWQQPFHVAALGGVIAQPIALALAICCASISFYLVEQPARERLNAWFERDKVQSAISVHG